MAITNAMYSLPEDIKTEHDILSFVYELRAEAQAYHEPFIRNAEEDENFYEGEQWDREDKEELQSQNLPCLTLNKIFPLIQLVIGIHDQEPFEMRTVARSEEDFEVAKIMSECLQWTWDRSRGAKEEALAFKKGIITGRSWLGIEQNFDDDIFEGKTTIDAISGSEILYDPKSIKYDLSDCDYLIREKIISRSKARNLWPDKEPELIGYFHDYDSRLSTYSERTSLLRKVVPVIEVWYRVYKKSKFLVNLLDGSILEVSDIPSPELNTIIADNPYLKVISKKKRKLRYAKVCGYSKGVVLEHGDSPYNDDYYPYVPYFAYRGKTSDFGIVKNLKDPQREINKRDSQLLRILNTSVSSGIITDDSDLADDFEKRGNQPGYVGYTKPGARWSLLGPPHFPMAHAKLVEIKSEDLKRISGINDDLLGFREATQSGIAIDLRRRQGMSIIGVLFGNLMETTKLAAQLLISRIQQYMSEDTIRRIVGYKRATPEVVEAIKNVDTAIFDIIVRQVPSAPSIRLENFAKLESLLKLGVPIPPDIVIEASDIPQKEELMQRLNAGEQEAQPTEAAPLPSGATGLPPV